MHWEETADLVSGSTPPGTVRAFAFMSNLAAQETSGERDVSVSVERIMDDLVGSMESTSLLLTALDQWEEPAGWTKISFPLIDDPTTASLDVVLDAGFQPLPGQRMEAAAREMLDDLLAHGEQRAAGTPWFRSVFQTAHMHPAGGSARVCDHCQILESRGYELAHEEIQQILPVSLSDYDVGDVQEHPVVGTDLPTELMESIIDLHDIAAADVPHGALSLDLAPWSSERLAEQAIRMARSDTKLVSVFLSNGSGVIAMSSISIPPGAHPRAAEQGLTIVHPLMRGKGLGTQIKLACMTVLHAQFPQVTRVGTSNAVDNQAMLAVNRALGAREVSRTTLWEKSV